MAESMIHEKNDTHIHHQVLAQRKELRSHFSVDEVYPTPNEIDQVIVILGSSRSGSSLLHYLLSLHPEIISLQGEEVTFTKLFGMNTINSFEDSDFLKNANDFNFHELAQEILFDAGYNTSQSTRLPLDRAQRLLLQWPHLKFNLKELISACYLESWEQVIDRLKLNINLYDKFLLPTYEKRQLFLEEPPFIIPRHKTYQKQTPRKILLLKSSINAFRAQYLPKLFPLAQFNYIHLSRNPAASINGLIDGWLSPAFHSHYLGHLTKLSIKNYDDENWWKFDLPPGWNLFINKPLEEVCAFQWREANKSILDFLKSKKSIRIKYEEMIEPESLQLVLKKICENLSLADDFAKNITIPPPIMSVVPPEHSRWRKREQIISSVLKNESTIIIAKSLGYDVTNLDELK